MATTTNFGWETPDDTDLVKDGALAIRTLGSAIDTSLVDLKGGTTGQVLSKTSNTDMDFTWVTSDDANAIQNAIVDAKGDLITATAADTPARLAVGTNGQVLTADSTTATGLKWATAAGGGKVLQVVYADYATQVNIASTSYTDTGLSGSITPTSSSSKVLVLCAPQAIVARQSNTGQGATFQLLRGSTAVFVQQASATSALYVRAALGNNDTSVGTVFALNYLDSPATTSSVTYKLQGKVLYTSDSGSIYNQVESSRSTMILLEIGA